MQIVVFRLGEEDFAVETSKVQNISNIKSVIRVPKAESHIKGLINLRGNIISLIDINLLLDIPKSDCSDGSMIIIDIEDEEIAISVDKVKEVLEVDEKEIQKLDSDNIKQYVKGIINLKGQIITIIDLNTLL